MIERNKKMTPGIIVKATNIGSFEANVSLDPSMFKTNVNVRKMTSKYMGIDFTAYEVSGNSAYKTQTVFSKKRTQKSNPTPLSISFK